MKINFISQLVSIILVLIITAFGLTITWSFKQLNQAFATVEFCDQQKDLIFTQLSQPIVNYLSSGNLLLIAHVTQSLQDLKANVSKNTRISADRQSQFIRLLDDLEHITLGELSTVGKLADPQVLLTNNEQQVFKHLQTLLDYVNKAEQASSAGKMSYLQAISQAEVNLTNLSKARQSFLSSDNKLSQDLVNRYLVQLIHTIDELKKQPLLGVMKVQATNDDEFTLGDTPKPQQREDVAETPLAELTSLLQRYSKELANVQELLKNKVESQQKINQQILNLQQQLLNVQSETTEAFQQDEQWFYAVIMVFSCLILLVSTLTLFLNRHMVSILSQINTYIDLLAKGDLRSNFKSDSRISEIKHLKSSLDTLQNYFNLLITHINQESNTLNGYGSDILHVAQNLESIIADQQQATEMAAHQMQQLTTSFQDVAENANDSQSATTSAQRLVNQGVEEIMQTSQRVISLEQIIDDTATALLCLQEDVKAIEGVLGVIQGFTEQTNLLALNAAIEAARAGNHGRGFAVVADEVRKLATHTASSAKQIQRLIEKLNAATLNTVNLMNKQQTAVKQTNEAMQQVNAAFSGIKTAINNINDKTLLIAIAAKQQAESTVAIANNFRHTAELARKTSGEAQNNKINASCLAAISTSLHNLIAQFKVS
jgi:methyl-accepting chemotaxis protein